MQMKTIDIRSFPPAMSTLSNVNYFCGPPTVLTTVENKDDIQHVIASLCFHVRLPLPTTLSPSALASQYLSVWFLCADRVLMKQTMRLYHYSALSLWYRAEQMADIKHKNRNWLHRWAFSKVNTPSGHVVPLSVLYVGVGRLDRQISRMLFYKDNV